MSRLEIFSPQSTEDGNSHDGQEYPHCMARSLPSALAPTNSLGPAVLVSVPYVDDVYLAHVRVLKVVNARETPEQITVKLQSSYE